MNGFTGIFAIASAVFLFYVYVAFMDYLSTLWGF